MIGLNLAALASFFAFGWLFQRAAYLLRPELRQAFGSLDGLPGILVLIAVSILVILLHELVHGIFFWLFTRELPKFGFRGVYAFAAAPDWYLPRNQFIVVGLAPLVSISLAGLAGTLIAPVSPALVLLFATTINAAGAVGDIAVILWLLNKPPAALINDVGDAFTVYLPGP